MLRDIVRQADSAGVEVIGVVSELEDVANWEIFLGEMTPLVIPQRR